MLSLVVLLTICILTVRSNNLSTKFNIVLKTPGNTTLPTELPHKSVHVGYTKQNWEGPWNIVGFELQIQEHLKAVEQITVQLCNLIIYRSIWYDDQTVCGNAHSMLIYEWKPHYSIQPFLLPDDTGFEFTRSKSLILTVIYRKEKHIHKERSGVVLYMSTQPVRFKMGTMFVGNQERGTQFSCRSSTVPRLLFGVKKLIFDKKSPWWRVHVIRTRQFGRKLVQLVLDSDNLSSKNQSNIEHVSTDVFLMSGDYLLLECENSTQSNCYFLVYYTYKSKSIENENFCQYNDYPNLFKLIPPKESMLKNRATTNASGIDGSTVFLIIGILLLITWISIIIGCIIMRRIRGLVNFRPEPSSSLSSKNKLSALRSVRGPQDNFQRGGDADHIIQMDGEHGGG